MSNADIHAPARGPGDHSVRDQIVAAATEHFSYYGYEKTTVSDLARAIGFSKAYIYKFFASKQAIGEAICHTCLLGIERQIEAAISSTDGAPEQLRRMFRAAVEASVELFNQDRKLYEIAVAAASEGWPTATGYEARVRAHLQAILERGRAAGDFERRTPLDEAAQAVYLVMRPYLNPLLLRESLRYSDQAPGQLSSLILRSLSP
ncbi:TetR/AcrR family transcriptional regulator [Stenotrophomonas sp. ISL-67]|uniref:TetR/AcrR family transcriptional regulator n=1 Tax=Stenotrophomonas sp. ISL-67 TaxID=2819171 RepID=UPI001BE796BC|nr:TetR/AcrR family transcriptional regulator [Stenotrophomonas sp. ISL-67]MBT2766255.1 TetR/AcrR family transcriptional regulator [Stenotrophomonas sp. ISL-67]